MYISPLNFTLKHLIKILQILFVRKTDGKIERIKQQNKFLITKHYLACKHVTINCVSFGSL